MPEVIGYIVAVPGVTSVGETWDADWDGVVHETEEKGRESLTECRTSGWPDAVLTKMVKLSG